MDDTKTQGYTFTFGEQAASRDSPKHRGHVEELTLNKSVTPVSSPKQVRMRMKIGSSLFWVPKGLALDSQSIAASVGPAERILV